MTTQLSARQRVCYIKSQGSLGTAATIAQASDKAVRLLSCEFSIGGEGLIERDDTVSASGLPAAPVQGSKYWDIVAESEYFPFSDYGSLTSSAIAPLLRATADVALDSTTYSPAAAIALTFGEGAYTPGTTRIPLTIECHDIGGNVYRSYDCFGTADLMMDEAGKRVKFKFTLQGVYETPSASTFTIAATDYGNATQDPIPMTFCGATVTSGLRYTNGSTEDTITGLTALVVTPAMVVEARPDATQLARSCYGVPFVGRTGKSDTVAFTCDNGPEEDSADGISAWTSWVAQARGRTATWSINGGSGKARVDIVMAEVHYRAPAPKDDKTFRQYDLMAINADSSTHAGVRIYLLAGS